MSSIWIYKTTWHDSVDKGGGGGSDFDVVVDM